MKFWLLKLMAMGTQDLCALKQKNRKLVSSEEMQKLRASDDARQQGLQARFGPHTKEQKP